MRVLVVDDDPAFRRALSTTLAALPGVEVSGTVASNAEAKAFLSELEVDVITLDVVLREEYGLDLIPWLQKTCPRAIVILVTSGSRHEARTAVDALFLGASSLILKPSGPDAPLTLRRALEAELAVAAKRLATPVPTGAGRFILAERREVIAVGASTGGPPVVLELLKALPTHFRTPLVLTQHMPAFHVPFFVDLLARQSGRDVRVAADGEVILDGVVYVAPGDRHMTLRRPRGTLSIALDDGPMEHGCRPAVDPMFRSVAATCGRAAVGVVLTGMGVDGAAGASAMRGHGAPIVVQDRVTSVVWGMPGAVVAAGAADTVVPGPEVARHIIRWTASEATR